jgi:hypothetical protein
MAPAGHHAVLGRHRGGSGSPATTDSNSPLANRAAIADAGPAHSPAVAHSGPADGSAVTDADPADGSAVAHPGPAHSAAFADAGSADAHFADPRRTEPPPPPPTEPPPPPPPPPPPDPAPPQPTPTPTPDPAPGPGGPWGADARHGGCLRVALGRHRSGSCHADPGPGPALRPPPPSRPETGPRLTLHVSRFTFHVSRFPFHVSRFTPEVTLAGRHADPRTARAAGRGAGVRPAACRSN